MKTYAPKGLHGAQLRPLLDELHCTPLQAAKFLRVTERTVWRWLAEDGAPWHVLALLWHETETGRMTCNHDVGNALVLARGLSRSFESAHAQEVARLARLVRISDTGAANDPLVDFPGVCFTATAELAYSYPGRDLAEDSTSACETGRWPCGVESSGSPFG